MQMVGILNSRLYKVLLYQSFSNSGVHHHRMYNVMPRQAYDPGKKLLPKGTGIVIQFFTNNDFTYSTCCTH